MVLKQNFTVITGGPGVGKTTLLEELDSRGFAYVAEGARAIIKEQVGSGGNALPWKDTHKYSKCMMEHAVATFISALRQTETLFFDRGLPDTMAYCHLAGIPFPENLEAAVNTYRYHKKVFILPPWKEIYHVDKERKQDFEEATATFRVMMRTYQRLHYTLVEVPKSKVAARADFVLQHITSGSANNI